MFFTFTGEPNSSFLSFTLFSDTCCCLDCLSFSRCFSRSILKKKNTKTNVVEIGYVTYAAAQSSSGREGEGKTRVDDDRSGVYTVHLANRASTVRERIDQMDAMIKFDPSNSGDARFGHCGRNVNTRR